MCMQFFTNAFKGEVKQTKDLTMASTSCPNRHTLRRRAFPPEQQLLSRQKRWAQRADLSLGFGCCNRFLVDTQSKC